MNEELHKMYGELIEKGATKEDIMKVYKMALETADRIINNDTEKGQERQKRTT